MLRRVRAVLVILGVSIAPAALAAPPSPRNGDIAEAVNFVREVGFDKELEGLEPFFDYDPTEALGILLDNQPDEAGRLPGVARRTDHFERAGGPRLDYARLREPILAAARATGLPAALIDAVIRTESGYRVQAVSRAGAQGLMQLMPGTAREVGVRDPFDPAQNVLGGARYLRRMYDRFRSLRLAVAAYNAGPGAVERHGGIPPFEETRRYVKTVLDRYQRSPIQE